MNAYEIRLDLLKLARGILEDKQSHAERMYSTSLHHNIPVNANSISASLGLNAITPYTEIDVINTASKLYSFVQEEKKEK